MAENEVNIIKERLIDEFNRYRMNLEIVLAIKYLIESEDIGIQTYPPERKVKVREKSEKMTPDLILHDNNQNFVINEIKTSINPDRDNLEQVIDYLNIESVLDDDGNLITPNNYSLNFIVNIESYTESSTFFFESINNDLIQKFSISSFVHSESVPRRGTRYYLFELRDNQTILIEYNRLLMSRPIVYEIDILQEGEQIYFTNDPLVQYTITILWAMIIPSIKIGEEFTFEDAQNTMRDYYCRWDQNRVFFKKKWLKKAITKLLEMKWIREVRSDTYQIIKTLALRGNLSDIICDKLAKLEFQETERERPSALQVNMDRFL